MLDHQDALRVRSSIAKQQRLTQYVQIWALPDKPLKLMTSGMSIYGHKRVTDSTLGPCDTQVKFSRYVWGTNHEGSSLAHWKCAQEMCRDSESLTRRRIAVCGNKP